MLISLLVSLLLVHFIADFVLQTETLCVQKKEKKCASWFMYVHALIVAGTSLIAFWNIKFWCFALIIGASHLLIDLAKAALTKEDDIWTFAIDQILHIAILIIVTYASVKFFDWTSPRWFTVSVLKAEAIALAVILCWKPANIFVKNILVYNNVKLPDEKMDAFHAGKLIGTLERWLILAFIILGKYEVIGFLIAAKSIIRFGNKSETEYFLVGTLLSIAIAVLVGLLVCMIA